MGVSQRGEYLEAGPLHGIQILPASYKSDILASLAKSRAEVPADAPSANDRYSHCYFQF
jgi:hypothetical protein